MAISSKTLVQDQTGRLTDGLARHLAIAEMILRGREVFFNDIRDSIDLPAKIQGMLISSVAFLALYGAVIGSSLNLYQTFSSAIKLPALFLITAVICLPTLYFFNVLFGAKQSVLQSLALILTPITVSAVLIFSFAPITFFFLLTTRNYQFFKLLNVAFFALAGVIGMWFLAQGMRAVSGASEPGARVRTWTNFFWIVVFAFVGSQMAWTLRPFIGYPGAKFEILRQLGGNFYVDILGSMGEVLGFFIVK